MYIPSHELTLSEEEIEAIAQEMCEAGFRSLYRHDLSFQSRANRDAVARRAKQLGAGLEKSSIRHQIVDPRYTVEGRHLPDKGMANETVYVNLYTLKRVY